MLLKHHTVEGLVQYHAGSLNDLSPILRIEYSSGPGPLGVTWNGRDGSQRCKNQSSHCWLLVRNQFRLD